jgi:two-component system sensor histidine kinase ChiS
LIQLHGGHIWVDSREDEGSTFTFSLPLATQAGQVRADHEFKTISYRSQDRHILLVEDEEELASRIVRHLQNLGGYRVHVSKRVRDALDYVHGMPITHDVPMTRRIDLIALDLRLPDMNGGDLIKALQGGSATRDIPIVAIASGQHPSERSGNSDVERQHVLDLGAVRFLDRPFEIVDLASEIQLALPNSVESLPVGTNRVGTNRVGTNRVEPTAEDKD